MTILETFIRLRDDLKIWVINNLNNKANISDLDNKLDKSAMSDIEAYIHQSIYGIVDGTIENISNNKATYVRDYSFYQHQKFNYF